MGFSSDRNLAPRYDQWVDPRWCNVNLIRNRKIITDPSFLVWTCFNDMNIDTKEAPCSQLLYELLEIIPEKHLTKDNCKKRKSVKNRFAGCQIDADNNKALLGVNIFAFDKTTSEKSKICDYIRHELGVKAHFTNNLIFVDSLEKPINTFSKLLYLAEIITWLGELNED